MVLIDGKEYPEHFYYDLDDQIWYEPLKDGTVRVGFTPAAMDLAGEIFVFTPKRAGYRFEAHRSFAIIEGGKWVGAAHATFAGVIVTANSELQRCPALLNEDPFGAGWMLTVRPEDANWRDGLLTGPEIGPAFSAWIAGSRPT